MNQRTGMIVSTLLFFGGASLILAVAGDPDKSAVYFVIGVALIAVGIWMKRRVKPEERPGLHDGMMAYLNCLIALIVIGVGEALPPMQELEAWIAPRRAELAWKVGGTAFFGWAVFMGAVLYRIFKGGTPLTRDEIAVTIKSVKDGIEVPYAMRVSKYWVPKWAKGGGFHDEMSIHQFKEAWRLQLWRHDFRWRGVFLIAFGAAVMTFGIFGLPIVLGPPGIKFLCGLGLLYSIVRTVGAFLKK